MRIEPEGQLTPPDPHPREEAIEQRTERILHDWLYGGEGMAHEQMDSLLEDPKSGQILALELQRLAHYQTTATSAVALREFHYWLLGDMRQRAKARAREEIETEERETRMWGECDDPLAERPVRLFGYHGED